MSQPCAVSKCERTSRAPCDCCLQNLCLFHLNEHNALLISRLNPLTDEINALGERLKSFSMSEISHTGRQKLEQWRKDCHEKIDRVFEQKCEEVDRLFAGEINQQGEKILQLKSKMSKLVREQEATRQDIDSLTLELHQLRQEMNKLEEITIQINTRSLILDGSFVEVRKSDERELNLSNIGCAYKTFHSLGDSYVALTSNSHFLLMHEEQHLCLIDREMNKVKQVLWSYNLIADMCWSSTLDRFIVITNDDIFLVDEKTLSINNIENTEKRSWLSCTCSDTSLFLATNVWGSSVIELKLLPTIEVIKEWKSPITCRKSELIHAIDYSNETLAMVIKRDTEKPMRIALRSCATLENIWSLSLDIISKQNGLFSCCSLNGAEWLVTDYATRRLLQITKDGKLKITIPYDGIPLRANLFTSDILSIYTDKGINLHKI